MGAATKKKKRQQPPEAAQHDGPSTILDESAMAGTSGSTGAADESSAYASMPFADVLEDLSSRFIVNLPAEELVSIERICFQVEQAHWFYEDFLRPLNPSLPSLALRKFTSYLLHSSALTLPIIQRYITSVKPGASGKNLTMRQQQEQQGLDAAFEEFLKYKTRVPVCGAVILNDKLDKCLLVKGWKSSATWGFPKGKINKEEPERDCAIREVHEETGFDCSAYIPADSEDYMELTMQQHRIRLYIVPGVDEATEFATLTRKEISKIAWFKLSDLPTWKEKKGRPQEVGGKFYLVSPFIGKLKGWIKRNRNRYNLASNYDSDDQQISSGHDIDESAVNPLFDASSEQLKSLLGLGPASDSTSHAEIKADGTLLDSRGAQMIEQQGDERGRQLLDLLRGDHAAGHLQDQPATQMDDRERGQAALLAALHAGAGHSAPSLAPSSATASHFLNMLNGPAPVQVHQLPPASTPLPAPQAQRVHQAQSLLSLISPARTEYTASPQYAPAPQSQQLHATQMQQPTLPYQAQAALPDVPLPLTQANGSSLEDRERERARQREKLLSDLLSSSLNLGSAPSNTNMQQPVAPLHNPHVHPAMPQQVYQSMSPQLPQQGHASNDLLSMLNVKSPQQMPQVSTTAATPQQQQGAFSANGPSVNAGSLLASLSAQPSQVAQRPAPSKEAQPARAAQPSPFSMFMQQQQGQQLHQPQPSYGNQASSPGPARPAGDSLLNLLNVKSPQAAPRSEGLPASSLPYSPHPSQQGAHLPQTQFLHNPPQPALQSPGAYSQGPITSASLLAQLSPSAWPSQQQHSFPQHLPLSYPHGQFGGGLSPQPYTAQQPQQPPPPLHATNYHDQQGLSLGYPQHLMSPAPAYPGRYVPHQPPPPQQQSTQSGGPALNDAIGHLSRLLPTSTL